MRTLMIQGSFIFPCEMSIICNCEDTVDIKVFFFTMWSQLKPPPAKMVNWLHDQLLQSGIYSLLYSSDMHLQSPQGVCLSHLQH